MTKLQDHTVTASQSKRIGIPTGTVIQVEMYTEKEIQERLEKVPTIRRIAKHYYRNGKRVGGILDLDD